MARNRQLSATPDASNATCPTRLRWNRSMVMAVRLNRRVADDEGEQTGAASMARRGDQDEEVGIHEQD